jgi:glycosyltransferase involved in cell wall biosynthesis
MNNFLKNATHNKPLFSVKPVENLKISIVIPCFNEKNIIKTLQSIKQNSLPENIGVEVITIVNDSKNSPEDIKKFNKYSFNEIKEFAHKNNTNSLQFLTHYENNIPEKIAGVGYARKMGMDEAVRRLNHPNGIICCLDADCTVSENYISEIYHQFKNPDYDSATIYFEHPVKGNEFSSEIYQAIYYYELHLRYYKNALQFIGFPYAIYTVGSSMAVKAGAYCKQGGMNKRKAGEDFYFLQKMCKLSKPIEINNCTVYPSPRKSARVPFGTGKAIADIIDSKNIESFTTYAFESFLDLRQLFNNIDKLYRQQKVDFPKSISAFLSEIDFEYNITEIRNNAKDFESFKKRFFMWFNAFKVLKFIHFSRDNFYPNQPVVSETKKLLSEMKAAYIEKYDLLYYLRNYDRCLHSET